MTILALILILLGIAGSVLPFLPGPPLSFAGLLLYGFAENFQKTSPLILVVFGILTVLTVVLDFIAPALGAKGYKASFWGVLGSAIGAIVGIFVLGPFGIILGPLIGGFAGEYLYVRDTNRALKSAWGSFLGFVAGSVIRFGVAVAMAAYFVYLILK